MDWNNDNKKDLLTGENNGRIRIYLNTGTDAAPAFSGYTYVYEGATIFDGGSYSVVEVADWNHDGKKDVLCGESSGGVYLMLNVGTDAAPVFNSKAFLQDGAVKLDPGGVTRPCVVDWNKDGKKDLLLGETYGNIFYYENVGTDADPAFNGYQKLKAGPGLIDVGYYSRPCVTDFDEDGMIDILTGDSNGNVIYFKAIGALSVPQNFISAGTGGVIDLDLNLGRDAPNRDYVMLGSLHGSSPGFPLPGGQAVMNLNWDWFTTYVYQMTNTTVFDNFAGTLSADGTAQAHFNTLGPVPNGVGLTITFAFALTGPWDFGSNGVNIEIVP